MSSVHLLNNVKSGKNIGNIVFPYWSVEFFFVKYSRKQHRLRTNKVNTDCRKQQAVQCVG